MSRPLPASEDLETFLTIVDTGSLTSAARALRQPKSTLSRRMARLEETLGVPLLVRGRQRVELSETGLALVEFARESVRSLRDLANAADRSRGVPEGRLRVSIPLDLAGRRDIWLGFSLAYPAVALELEPSNRQVDVIGERFDLALRGGRGTDEALVARPVGEYLLVAVASPGYVERWGRLAQPTQLRQHSCILFRPMPHRPGYPDHPELPHRHLVCPDEAMALEACRQGVGIAILRRDVVQQDLDAGTLVSVLDAYNPLRVPVYAVHAARAQLRAAVTAFIEYVAARLV